MSLDGFVQLIFNVYEAYTVALYVQEGRQLSCFSAYSFAKSFDKAKPLELEGTLPGWTVKHKEPLIIGNFDKDEQTLGYYAKTEDIKSFMAYPLDTPGVIIVDSKKKWVFTDKEKKILAHFVAVLGKEVERERRLREMEEEYEDASFARRMIRYLSESHATVPPIETIMNETLSLCGADLVVAGVERKGRIGIVGAAGAGAEHVAGAECPTQGTIAATVLEGGRELILPYDSAFLREKPLLFSNDGIRAKQYFSFPLTANDAVYGFLGFASLSAKRLREDSIGVLRDTSTLLSLYLTRINVQQEMEHRTDRDPVSGAPRFGSFLSELTKRAKQRKNFSLMSIKLLDLGSYNRTLGVQTTDDILKKIYQGIQHSVGPKALATRSGGGHFYVAIDGSDMIEGQNIVNVIRVTMLPSLSIMGGKTKRAIELGTAYFPKDSEDVWELFDIAEKRGREAAG